MSARSHPKPTPSDIVVPIIGPKQTDLTPDDIKALKDILQACDSSLTKCEEANKDKGAVIEKQQEELNAALNDEEDLRSSSSSIINNKLLWFGLGVVFTGLAYKLTH